MPVHTLTKVGRTSGGVILPKSDLRQYGVIDEDGDVEGYPVRVDLVDDGTWEVELIDPDDYPE